MLVLTRKTNEIITIGNDIEITVVEALNNRVRLGIAAPPDMPVFRKELLAQGTITKTIPLCHCNGDEPLKGTNK